MPEEVRQVLELINPVEDSNGDDDDIFEPERSFSRVFNTFVNQWSLEKDKNVFKLAFRFYAFLKIPEMLETRAHKNFNFQHYHEI